MSAELSYSEYEAGVQHGIEMGRRQADYDASVKWANYLPILRGGSVPHGYPSLAQATHSGEAKPLKTPEQCLATWEVAL